MGPRGIAIDPSSPGSPAGSPAGWALAVLALLLAAAAAAVAPALDGDFTFDEHAGVAGNRAIHPGAPALEALSYRFSPDQARPLFFLSLWMDARWHGTAPRGFRITNTALHLLCGIAVWLLLRRAAAVLRTPETPRVAAEGAALAGTALFLLHPLQAESVIYIWGRSGVLAVLLALGALLIAPPSRDRPGGAPGGALHPGPPLHAWLPSWILLALALAAKEEAVVLPLVALVWWTSAERRPARSALSGALRLAAPVALFLVIRVLLLGAAGRQVYVRSVAENVLGQGVVTLRMIRLALWPAGQSVDHPAGVPVTARGLAAAAACAVLAGAALLAARRRRPPALRVAATGVLIAAAGMLLYWLVPLPDLMSERRAYMPLFGMALSVTALAMAVARSGSGHPGGSAGSRRATAVAVVPVAAIVLLLAPLLRERARLWADPALLWEEASGRAPARARPQINLGVIAAERGDLATAALHLDRAVALEPGNPEALYNRGRLRLESGDAAGAETDLRASVAADPTVPRARINLAAALTRLGRLADAEDEIRLALAIDPGEPRALTNLAEILRNSGRAAEALPLYHRALASDPGYAHAAARLGLALEEAGDGTGALRAYREYLRRGAATEADARAVRERIAALEAALAAPGSIR